MARPKNDGKGRLGGRAKGTPNKTTTDLKKWIADILDNGRERFEESLTQLEPHEYIRVFSGLLNYALPKMASSTPDDVLRKEKEMLQDLLLSMPQEMINRVAERLFYLKERENDNPIRPNGND